MIGDRLVRAFAFAWPLTLVGCGEVPERPESPPPLQPPGATPESIIPRSPRRFAPDPPAMPLIRALDRKLVGAVEYETEGIFPDLPLSERYAVSRESHPTAPSGARVIVHEFPVTDFQGRRVACGGRHVRIELYDDETIDIIAHDRLFTTDWYEMEDGTRVRADTRPAEEKQLRDRRLYHVTAGGEYTIQSLTPGVQFPRTADSADRILEQNVPWKIVERALRVPGVIAERNAAGNATRIEVPASDGLKAYRIECSDWEDLPVKHPRVLTQTHLTRKGDVDKVVRFTRIRKEDG